jgi:exosortase/archaeosortase family protein
MGTPIARGGPAGFLLAAAAWVTGLFGLLRIPLVQEYVVLPLTRTQGGVAAWGQGAGALPVVVTLECSGTDVMALLVAFCFSYPCPWPRRLWGAGGGVGLLLAANVVRIASLAQIAGTPAFLPVHTYVWPATLVLITLAYAIAWMWTAEEASGPPSRRWLPFAAVAGAFVCLFMALLPLLGRLPRLAEATRWYAASAASFLAVAGLTAGSEGSTLVTRHGAFLVTPECLVTPLMPVYLAAALTVPRTWAGRLAAVLAFGPVFALLAWARLLTLALPAALIGSPILAVHGFHQLVLGALVVLAAGLHGAREGQRRAQRLAAAAAVAVLALLIAPAYGAVLEGEGALLARVLPHTLRRLDQAGDSQGALAMLPAFQVGLLAALWLAAGGARQLRSLAGAIALLHCAQLILLVVLGELGRHAEIGGPVTLVRAWALLAPVGLYGILARRSAAIQVPIHEAVPA